jgi:hypothetical protein
MRPINPLAALTLVLVFPGRTFRRLVLRPHWIVPLAFVAASVVVTSLLVFSAGFMDEAIRQEAFLTGVDPDTVRAGTPAAMIVSGVSGVVVATLLQTLFYLAIARLFGGRGRFRTAFSAVCHASVPVGLMAVLLTALIPFTHSAELGANLSFLFDQARQPFLWGIASQIDVAVIWFFLLLGIAAEPVFELDRRRARAATAVFAVASILTLGWLAGHQPSVPVDPYAGWDSTESSGCVLHYPKGAPDRILHDVTLAFRESAREVQALTGLRPGGPGTEAAGTGAGPRSAADGESAVRTEVAATRIDCYLYPSLEEKRRATGNQAPVHRVEWANAIHLAWVDGTQIQLTRELLKLEDARVHGKVYNPLVRDGLAVFAGGSWAGMSVRQAGRDLLSRHALPDLDELVDPIAFADMDKKISEPAAGSFIAFMMSEIGAKATRDIYEASAADPEDVRELLEKALGGSLDEIDSRWRSYLEAESSEPGASTPGKR